MKSEPRMNRRERRSCGATDGRRGGHAGWSRIAVVCLLSSVISAAVFAATYPQWWSEQSVLKTGPEVVVNDYAPATVGQLKWVATKAADELNACPSVGAGPDVTTMVASFSQNDNYAPAAIGQAKNVAKLIYDRLIAAGYTDDYPWTATTTDDNDFAPLNLGQLKTLFNFDLRTDTDGDGMPDWWELAHGLNPAVNDAGGDADGDQLTNLQEYQAGSDPQASDSDGDGFDDAWEVARGLNPAAEPSPDSATLVQLEVYRPLE